MRRSVFLFLSALLWSAPVPSQAGGLKVTYFASLAGGYPAVSSVMAGSGSYVSHAPIIGLGWQANYSTVLDGVSTGAKFVAFATSMPMGDMLQMQGGLAEMDFGFGVSVLSVAGFRPGRQSTSRFPFEEILAATTLRTSVNSKSMVKFGKAYDSAAARYFLQPVCSTPLPPCCCPPCPCPCPCPCPYFWPPPLSDLRGKYIPPWGHVPMMKAMGAKVLPHGVRLTLNTENLGPVVDDAMRKLATQYPGFKNEYIASGSGKLEPRPKMERLK